MSIWSDGTVIIDTFVLGDGPHMATMHPPPPPTSQQNFVFFGALVYTEHEIEC